MVLNNGTGEAVNGITSTIKFEGEIVKKTVKTKIYPDISLEEHTCLEREIFILDLIKGFEWAPKVLNIDGRTITMENKGVRINKHNIPKDAVFQMQQILLDLQSINVEHNDIKDEEILVKDGKLSLCDYGWASTKGDFSCGKPELSKLQKPHGIFLDSGAISICENLVREKYSELHILIDWSMKLDPSLVKAKLISANLRLAVAYKAKYDDVNIASRFYNQVVRDERFKTPLNIFLVYDENPVYEKRRTTKGVRLVNTSVFDLKQELRRLAEGSQIHATDNIQETRDNLKVLGLSQHYPDKNFNNLEAVFTALNSSNCNYVVMRNFEELPNNAIIDDHLDIDVLTDDYYAVKRIVGGDAVEVHNRFEDGGYRILNWINVGKKRIMMDIRVVGDDYYCEKLEQDMLSFKKYDSERNIWIPSFEYHKYGLMYHAFIHKNSISKTYQKVFSEMGLLLDDIPKELTTWLTTKKYEIVRPKDKSVIYNLSSFSKRRIK